MKEIQSDNLDKRPIQIEVGINIENNYIPKKTKPIRIKVGENDVQIHVPEAIHARFMEQFVRGIPTPLQKRRYQTLMYLLAAAYIEGESAKVESNLQNN